MFFKVFLFVTFEIMLERRLYGTKLIFGFGRAKNGTRANLSLPPIPPIPALSLAPFFAPSLTFVSRSLIRNRTGTIAAQAKGRLIRNIGKWYTENAQGPTGFQSTGCFTSETIIIYTLCEYLTRVGPRWSTRKEEKTHLFRLRHGVELRNGRSQCKLWSSQYLNIWIGNE